MTISDSLLVAAVLAVAVQRGCAVPPRPVRRASDAGLRVAGLYFINHV
jgi:hypothetical protein